MTTTRRTFLAQAGAAAGALSLAPAALAGRTINAKKQRILILGGTGFLGPHIVWDALERGHEVTLFNRGKTNPDLFDSLETLIGDRYSDYASLSAAVAEGRTWDSVIDTFAYVPQVVEDAMAALKPAIDHYVVVSTMSVYASSDEPNADESAALNEVTDEVSAAIPTHREVGVHYGAMKARCEHAAERLMPGRVAIPRPGLICGARDTTGRFSYWPVRASEGGTMIAPGTPDDPMQIIDVRDLAAFILGTIEDRATGPYNVVTAPGELTIGGAIAGSIAAAGAETTPEWIEAGFLASQGVQAWQHMPAWVPPSTPGYAGFGLASTDRARAAGLSCRPVTETARAVLEYYTTRPAILQEREGDAFDAEEWKRRIRGGLAPEREAEVLRAWADRGGQ
ncbi:MAG: NAD-dependent epimerase/dehydratase family protein [Planctomycetota bacterium]